MTEAGRKNDAGKPRLSLLSSKWLTGVAQVLTFGATKYDPHNWRKGIEASRLLDAAQRHLLAFQDGEDNDPETGLSHLYHASCCIMFLSELRITRPDLDDRYKGAVMALPNPPPVPLLPTNLVDAPAHVRR